MKGRRPKPLALHKLHGTLRDDRHGDAPDASGTPDVPQHLDDVAKTEFVRVCVEMEVLGTLAAADSATIAAYSQTYSRWVAAEIEIAKTGIVVRTQSGDAKVSPWVRVAETSLALMRQYAVELGLTPAARTRIRVDQPRPKDDFDRFLARTNSKWTGLLA